MTGQTTVLQLVLDHLQMGNTISTMADRIAIQKVVCLTQEAGLQLGYGYNWYVRGPYSPALAADYYQVARMRSVVESDAKRFVLTEGALTAVERVRTVLTVPEGVILDRVQWLELLASIAFLMKRYRFNREAAKAKIQMSKPLLFPYFDNAYNTLQQAGFGLE
jgi:uncharacterized protein YwgA